MSGAGIPEAPHWPQDLESLCPYTLLEWLDGAAQKFLEKYAPEKLEAIDADRHRLKNLIDSEEGVTICFLGNSGVGKSTLLNALAAGEFQVLPAGGIGPLTAQATEVRYSAEKRFRVTYHPKKNLWRLGFALETRLQALKRSENAELASNTNQREELNADFEVSELASNLTREERTEVLEQATSTDEGAHTEEDPLEGYIKQAKNIVSGKQFTDTSLEYLVDAIRSACNYTIKWDSIIQEEDQERIQRVREIMQCSDDERVYERCEGDDPRGFQEEMSAHAAGFLSPLIEKIEVGWPSDLLEAGVILVDLPGVGIAQDSYRDVTKSYVRDKARAVVLTVDRAGPTESTMDLIRSSGFWERLVGASDDPESDACAMLIAVTRVDDVTQTEWQIRSTNLEPGTKKPKKREVFAELVEEFKPRMKSQIVEQLERIGSSSNEAVNEARNQARNNIINCLEIHPVSAPELRKILADDEDDRSFLASIDQTGIPVLQASLKKFAQNEALIRADAINEVRRRLATTLISELKLIESKWEQRTRAAEDAERLETALKPILAEKQEEYRARASSFRNFLDETVPAKIETLVFEAREVAEEEVGKYLKSLKGAHWRTLQAAVRRGGTFYGQRSINLPDDITGYFLEPMAAVWGQKLLKDIRRKTGELASDTEQIVIELCMWAKKEGGASVKAETLQTQQDRISALAKQIKSVGKEAVDELRSTVKSELTGTIREPIKQSCKDFIQAGNDRGIGVKNRILELFSELARESTLAAKEPAIRILQQNATRVRIEVQQELKKAGDPIQDTADLIVERHEMRMKRSDAQKRTLVLKEIKELAQYLSKS